MADRVIWSPRAAAHPEGICEYIAHDSPRYAAIFAQQILRLVRALPDFPLTGRIVQEYDDPDLREKIHGNYRIVYRMRGSRIEIVAICHGARLIRNVVPVEES